MQGIILTAQPEALSIALAEAGSPKVAAVLGPGVALVEQVCFAHRPVFVRHLCPAQGSVGCTGEGQDIGRLKQEALRLEERLTRDRTFSVQTRILDGAECRYGPFDVNTVIAGALAEKGYVTDVRKPGQVVSVTVAGGEAYVGVSRTEENLSDWAGGMRRFRREEGQVSRAEFKLLEALEYFALAVPEGGTALDLGAAPGGWTRVLRQRGLTVTAVDPALLRADIAADPGVRHMRMTAQAFLEENRAPFDLIVNDMKMDAVLSAALMREAAGSLREGGSVVLTLKLPERPDVWQELVRRAVRALSPAYTEIRARQLFHNRSEVTVAAVRKQTDK